MGMLARDLWAKSGRVTTTGDEEQKIVEHRGRKELVVGILEPRVYMVATLRRCA